MRRSDAGEDGEQDGIKREADAMEVVVKQRMQ